MSHNPEPELSMDEVKTYKNLIDGRWVESSSGKTFSSINPADTSDVLGYFQQGTLQETEQAIEAARRAQPSWARTPPAKRLSLIHISEPTRLLSISYAVFCLKK